MKKMSLRNKALTHMINMFADGLPRLRLVLWDGSTFDFGSEPLVTITLSSPSLWRALLQGNFFRLGDGYVKGELTVDGRPEDIIGVGVKLAERLERFRALGALKLLTSFRLRQRSFGEDAANVRRHYDISNDFFRLWLDRRLVYSCAYFRNGTESLDLAQEQKLEHICRKLMLRPGESLLDVGCGWGAFLRWATENHGVQGYGITLSENQFSEAKRALAHLGGKVSVALQNFKELEDDLAFDKIASIGMYEHVGASAICVYFTKMARMLKPGGLFLNHGIIAGSKNGPSGGAFIERYVFPGGSVSPLSTIISEITSSGLEVIDVEDLRPHYVRTLTQWSERLEEHKEAAIEFAGVETYRIWRIYLAGMAHAFEHGWLSVAQVLSSKPMGGRPTRRPWTRAHQYVS
ncbi:MAG: class I SAM-dependent methyltransferase [Methylocystis sp.]